MPRCWKGGCDQELVGELHAQWTLVDFVDYETCLEHVQPGLDILGGNTVDGQLPLDVWVTYWWPGTAQP